jgi:hypothetical protein
MTTNEEKLFDDLMEYTDFTDSDQIKNADDLDSYFEQLADNSITTKQKDQFINKYSRTRRAIIEGWKKKLMKGEKYERKSVKLAKSKVVFKGKGAYQEAKARGMLARTLDGVFVYKTNIQTFDKKSKEIKTAIRYRDDKGRFVSSKRLGETKE